MFRCDVCASVAPAHTRCNRLVVEIRPADYPARHEAHWHPPSRGGSGKWVDDPGGHGTEIVRELRACEPCAAKATAIDRDTESLQPVQLAG
jgi:hypothetical protein